MPRAAPHRARSPGTFELGQLVVQTRRLIWRRATAELDAVGETMPVWELVHQLHRLGPTCQQEVASSMAANPSRISRLLDQLEKDGTVVRRRDRGDRRKITVGLTARGRARHRRMRPLVLRAMEHTLAPLDADARRVLMELLSRVTK